jgi:AhpD family alkylhydroperoxidase
MGLLLDFADEAVLNKRHLEIALVTVSTLNACRYCVAHHAPRAIEHGLSAEAMEQILSESVPSFDAVDHLVRDYAVAVTNEWNSVRDDMFNRLREHFTEEQIVELTLRISLCGFFNRFNDVLQIDMEQGVLQDLLASGASENMLPASHN